MACSGAWVGADGVRAREAQLQRRGTADDVLGLILAGGRSRRFGGGDKCRRGFAGGSLLDAVIARLRPQVALLLLNANGDLARFAAFGLPVVADGAADDTGPLAGLLAGLEWALARAPGCRWVLSVPADGPFLPEDLGRRLRAAALGCDAAAACARGSGRLQPLYGLWAVRLAAPLRAAVEGDGLRKAEDWAQRCRAAVVDFSAEPVDPFFNVNRPEDLAEAERLRAQRTLPA